MSDLATTLEGADAVVGEFLLRLWEHVGPMSVTPASQVTKLLEEASEVGEAVLVDDHAHALQELADVVIVAAVASRVMGYRLKDLTDAVAAKMVVNLEREWASAGGAVRHV